MKAVKNELETPEQLQSKTDRIALLLEREIRSGVFKPNNRIYSMRDLCQRFNVSIAVVNCAYSRLEKLGLLERRLGSGTYVRPFKGTQKTFVLLTSIRASCMEHYYNAIFDAAHSSGSQIVPYCFSPGGKIEQAVDQATALEPAAVLVDFGERDCDPDILLKRLDTMPHCFVNRWEFEREFPPHAVLVDHNRILGEVFRYFFRQGHRRVLYLGHEREPRPFERKILEAGAAVCGLQFPCDQILYCGYRDFEECPDRLKAFFSGSAHPTAIVARSDSILYNFKVKIQLLFPHVQLLELFGCYDTVWAHLPANEFRSFHIDFTEIFQRAMRHFDWHTAEEVSGVEYYMPEWPEITTIEDLTERIDYDKWKTN